MSDEQPPGGLTHLDDHGRARMVDVGAKPVTEREARASARLLLEPETLAALRAGTSKKGDALSTARIAGIQAAKRTPELIPLCHAIALSSVEVRFAFEEEPSAVAIETIARASDRTGVEMEALTAASVAALTLYDMLKAMDRGMVIERVQLEAKRGGRSGAWSR